MTESWMEVWERGKDHLRESVSMGDGGCFDLKAFDYIVIIFLRPTMKVY